MSEFLENYLIENNLNDYVKPHQKDAIEWMYDRCSKKLGSLLADTMGLGKTLDICLLLQLIQARIALIVCSTSCIYSQWVINLCKYSFYYKVFVLKSNKFTHVSVGQSGNLIFGDQMGISEFLADPTPHKVVVSNSYAIAPFPSIADRPGLKASDYEIKSPLNIYNAELTPLKEIIWDVVIVDEVHLLKNGVNTGLDKGDKRKPPLKFFRFSRLRMNPNGGVRIGLTGTPIQNRTSDVVSMLSFLGVIFRKRVTEDDVKESIREYMFRRVADDLHFALRSAIEYPEIPPEEIIKDVVYESQAEADIYRIVAGKLIGSEIPGLELNPYSKVQYEENPLIRTNRECYLSADINMFIKIHNTAYKDSGIVLPYWHGTESKMNMIINDIVELSADNRSFICFIHYFEEMNAVLCKMKQVGLAMGLGETMGYKLFEISGNTSPEDRYLVLKETKRLIENGEKCICFATIQSCSDGLNMQHFDTIIFTTSDWNPANEDQAIARAYRPGQKKRVKVLRYIHRCIIDSENTKHIDLKKICKQDIKRSKFQEYITNIPNAAYYWPIRDMDGFEGEKCVKFSFSEPHPVDVSAINNTETIIGGSGRIYKPDDVIRGSDVSTIVDSFYRGKKDIEGIKAFDQRGQQSTFTNSLPIYNPFADTGISSIVSSNARVLEEPTLSAATAEPIPGDRPLTRKEIAEQRAKFFGGN